MADALRAAFTLKLHDEMSTGMAKIIAMTKQLRDLAKSLGFGKLDSADATLQRVGKDIGTINSGLGATARQAEAAASAIRRMSSAELERARAQAGRMRAIGSGRSLDQIYGPGGMPLMAGGSRFVPAEPGAMSSRGLRGRLGNAWDRTREGVGAFSSQVGLMGGAMAGISLEAPIHAAAELEQVLRQIAIIQHKSGSDADAEIDRLRRTLGADAIETGQPLQRLAEAYKFLITTGMSAGTVDQLMPIHSRAATAYHVDADTMGQAVFALHENLGISHDQMGGALAAMAQATQEAHFDMASMSRYLPEITGRMNMLGMTGRGSADKVFAALGTVVKNASDPAQAAIDFKDLMTYMTAPIARRSFAKAGINLPGVFASASKAGQDPMEAFINVLDRLTKTINDPVQKALALGQVLHNQQAGTAAMALLQHKDEYGRMRDELQGIGADKLNQDYQTAMAGLMPALMVRQAEINALEQRMGIGFSWTVPVSSALLGGVLVGMNWLDTHLPGVTTGALGLTAGMLGLVAVLGVLGTVAGPIKAGVQLLKLGAIMRAVFSASTLRLLVSPWVALPLMIGAAATFMWQHWSTVGRDLTTVWHSLGRAASGVGEFFAGVFSGDMRRAANGLRDIWTGVQLAWTTLWGPGGPMEQMFTAFDTWLGGFPGKAAQTLVSGFVSAFAVVSDTIKDFVHTWENIIATGNWTPALPSQLPSLAPPPDYLAHPPDYNADHPNLHNGDDRGAAGLRHPTSYSAPSGVGPQRIHITFESDVPGRATVRDTDGTTYRPAQRGPTLSRA